MAGSGYGSREPFGASSFLNRDALRFALAVPVKQELGSAEGVEFG